MGPAEQMDALRKMVRRGVIVWGTRFSAALALGLILTGILTGLGLYFLLSAFAAVVCFSARASGPHIRNAVEALERGTKKQRPVQIEITAWSDSPTYSAVLQDSAANAWRFEFIPVGWQPQQGAHEGTVFELPGVAWPALIQLEQGLIYPRYNPKRVGV